jgi:hypothetical protein
MTVLYAPDTDVLAEIQKAGAAPEVAKLGALPVVITEFVWDEFVEGPRRNGARSQTVTEAENLVRAMAGQPTELLPQTPEIASYVDLQTPQPTEGHGESSIIAYAMHHPETVPILLDRLALYRGVENLRGSVLSLHGFLRVLEQYGLPASISEAISRKYCSGRKPIVPPLWWKTRT